MEQREEKEDRVCPSESTEKEDRVCPSESTLGHQHEDQSKVQREPEPESSPTAESGYSSSSFRSDWSKDIITEFKSGQLSAVRSPEGSDSPLSVHSYPSRGSNRSTDIDLDFNNQVPAPPESYRRTYEELLQHLQEVIRQQEVQLQAERKAKRKAKQEAQEAERELKLKRREDQQHLKSGKNNSLKSEREPPGSIYSLSEVELLDLSCSLFEDEQIQERLDYSSSVVKSSDLSEDKQNDQK